MPRKGERLGVARRVRGFGEIEDRRAEGEADGVARADQGVVGLHPAELVDVLGRRTGAGVGRDELGADLTGGALGADRESGQVEADLGVIEVLHQHALRVELGAPQARQRQHRTRKGEQQVERSDRVVVRRVGLDRQVVGDRGIRERQPRVGIATIGDRRTGAVVLASREPQRCRVEAEVGEIGRAKRPGVVATGRSVEVLSRRAGEIDQIEQRAKTRELLEGVSGQKVWQDVGHGTVASLRFGQWFPTTESATRGGETQELSNTDQELAHEHGPGAVSEPSAAHVLRAAPILRRTKPTETTACSAW